MRCGLNVGLCADVVLAVAVVCGFVCRGCASARAWLSFEAMPCSTRLDISAIELYVCLLVF